MRINFLWLCLFLAALVGCSTTNFPPTTPAPIVLVEPASLEEFLSVSKLRESLEIEWHNAHIRSCIVIRDQAFIQRFVDAMLNPQTSSPISASEPTLLIFETNSLDQPADTRLISLNLDLAQATVDFKNISTSNWPIDLRGQYQLGDPQALLDLLATIESKAPTDKPHCE